jgi:hypothetical protein
LPFKCDLQRYIVEAARALPVRLPDIAIHDDGVYDNDGLNAAAAAAATAAAATADADDEAAGDVDSNAPPPPPPTRPTPVALHHDCVVRNPNRVPSEDLNRALGEVVGGWGAGFTHGMYARFKNPTDPEIIAGLRDTLRFVVIETAAGYILGLVNFAPQQLPPNCDWNRKPNNFCAGTRIEIAAVAINALVGAGAVAIKSAGSKGEVGGSSPATSKNDEKKTKNTRAVIVDPCCGGGTVLYAAWSRGYDAVGADINPHAVQKSRGNIAAFVPAMPLQHAALAAIAPRRGRGGGGGGRDGVDEGTSGCSDGGGVIGSDGELQTLLLSSSLPILSHPI